MFVRYPSHAYELEDDETGECIARGIVVEYSDSECFIDSVAVTPEYQGQGYGSQILQLILREYRTVKLYLAVESYGTERLDNQALEAWYSKYGFEWDETKKYMVRLPTTP